MLNEEIQKVYQIARAVAREEIARALIELKSNAPAPAPPPVPEPEQPFMRSGFRKKKEE